MAVIKPSLNTTTFKTKVSKDLFADQLAAAFTENSITTVRQVKLGLQKMRADESDFAPSIGKFISWCRVSAEDMGLPSPDEAYKIAAKAAGMDKRSRDWVHVCIKFAANKTGYLELKSLPPEKIKREFLAHYRVAVDDFSAGLIKDVQAQPFERVEHLPSDKDTAMKHIKNMKDML